MAVDLYRGTSGVLLPPAVSQDIWQLTQEQSGVMRAAQQIPLPGRGVSIPIITGDPTAAWVNETDKKPVSRPTLGNKTITPYTMAVIVPFSNQFRRDLSGLSPQGKSVFIGATDTVGRPLYLDSTTATGSAVAQLLGAPVYTTRASYAADADGAGAGTDKQYGYAGDWDNAYWGSVEGIQISISDQATLDDGGTPINLWQQNMFAVRAEIEVGFRVRDLNYFVKLTSATQS
jgi:hypothetical protein